MHVAVGRLPRGGLHRLSPLLTLCRKFLENPFPLFCWNHVSLSTTMRTNRSQPACCKLTLEFDLREGIVNTVPFRTSPGDSNLCAHNQLQHDNSR